MPNTSENRTEKENEITFPSTTMDILTSGKVLKDDTLQCFSRNQVLYRVLLTETEICFQALKNPENLERYELEDLFGIQTYRYGIRKSETKPADASAFICFTFYPRMKRGLITFSRLREKVQLVFQIQKTGFTFEENLEQATAWKHLCLNLLRSKFSKWQLENLTSQASTPAASPTSGEHALDKDDDVISKEDLNDWAQEEKGTFDATTHELAISLSSQSLLVRKFLVIVNPKSGQGKTLNIFKDTVYPVLCESGIKAVLLVTERAGHARTLVSSSDLSDISGIVTVGGDGLLYEVVNGLRSRVDANSVADIPVGVIAGGSGNGLARSIASYSGENEDYFKNPVLETTLAVARGRILPVNLLEVEVDSRKVYAFLSVGWGILADIDIESEVIRLIGESRFTLWSLLRVAKLRTYHATVKYFEAGGSREGMKVIEGDFVSVYASCQSHIGSDIIFAPKATANDGLIHLTIAQGDIGRARVTQFLLGLSKGSHVDVPGVEYVKVEEFSIFADGGISGTLTLDGEKVVGEKITARIASKPLNVFAL